MKRKLMAMTLALMMVLTVAISVSAATVTGGGTYEGYSYETVDKCTASTYSSTTLYDSMDYKVYSDVTLKATKYDSSGNATGVLVLGTVKGNPSYISSTTSGTSTVELASIYCEHYINGYRVSTTNVYAD